MKILSKLTGILLAIFLPGFLSGQTMPINWFPPQNVAFFSYYEDFVQASSGDVYRIYAVSGSMGLLAPLKFKVSRLDNQLKTVVTAKIDQGEIGSNSTLISLVFGEDAVQAIAFHYDEPSQKLTFHRALFDPKSLEQKSPFELFKTVEHVSWDSHQPNLYPLEAVTSPNNHLIAIEYDPVRAPLRVGLINVGNTKKDEEEVRSIFVLEDFETIYENEFPGHCSMGDVTNEGLIHLFQRNDSTNSHITIDIRTGEMTSVEMYSGEVSFRFWLEDQKSSILYSVFNSGNDEITYQIYCPDYMQAPIQAIIPADKSILFGKNFHKTKGSLMMQSQKVLDIHKTQEGNFVVTIEKRDGLRVVDPGTNMNSDTYSFGNIISFCFNESGEVLWVTSIPKDQEDDSIEFLSAITFRDTAGLHLIYNDRENNLTLGEMDKPSHFKKKSAGKAIIAHATISDEGQLSRTLLYDLTEDKMLLSLRDSEKISDDTIILNLRKGSREKLGILKIR